MSLFRSLTVSIVAIFCGFATLSAQVSSSAYRVLGQPNMQRNVRNQIEGAELRLPFGAALDTRNGATDLYVADTNNHRILVWRGALGVDMGRQADAVLGQPTFQQAVPFGTQGRQLVTPTAVAIHPVTGEVYVSDTGANRVLRFQNPFDVGASPDPNAVFGQPGFTTSTVNTGGVSPTSMRTPRGIAFDVDGNMWIADSDNNRVLRYPASALAPGVLSPAADIVLGQTDFTAVAANRGGLSAATLRTPNGIAFDNQGRLFVCDTGNSRVLVYNAPFTTGQAAAIVMGQASFNFSTVPGVLTPSTIRQPTGVAPVGGLVYVSSAVDNRILVFPAASTNIPAVGVLGQENFTSFGGNIGTEPLANPTSFLGPGDVKVDPVTNKIFVVDTSNNRVVAFDRGAKEANAVWGQPDFTRNSPNRINAESIAATAGITIDYSQQPYALYVSDLQNHRVLGWRDAIQFRNGQPADIVIGQPDFENSLPNSDTNNQTPTATSLSAPRGIAVDSIGSLYVADTGNNRVLRFPRPVDQTGRIRADLVIGQADFSSALTGLVNSRSLRAPSGLTISRNNSLFVADTGNNRVLEFPNGGRSAIRVFGQSDFGAAATATTVSAQSLTAPQGVAVDAFNVVYIADTGGNRVLLYTNTQDADAGLSADIVIGQPSMEVSLAGTSATRLRTPTNVVVDSNGRISVADSGNNRIVQYPSLLFLQSEDNPADGLYGQPTYNVGAANYNTRDGQATAEGISSPIGLFTDRVNTLYIGDTGNNRVLHVLLRATVANPANPASTAVSRGSLALIQGLELTDGSSEEADKQFPLSLVDREVLFSETAAAALKSASKNLIVLQVPSEAPLGVQRFAIRSTTTSELIAGGSITVNSFAPAIYTVSNDGRGQAVAFNEDGSENKVGAGALKGTVVTIQATGHGPLASAAPDGQLAPEVATAVTPSTDLTKCLTSGSNQVCLALGSTAAEIVASTSHPTMIGVWQLKVRVPQTFPLTGTVPIRLVVNGAISSNLPTIVVR